MPGVNLPLALSVSKLEIYSDSQLAVGHIQKEYEAKDKRMSQYLVKVRNTLKQLDEWAVKKIPRVDNIQVDALVRVATSLPIREAMLLPVHLQPTPSITESPVYSTRGESREWTIEIVKYLQTRSLLEDVKHVHRIRVQVAHFTLIGGCLYKQSFGDPYLMCLDSSEAQYVLAKLHEGMCGNHTGGRSLAHRAHS